MKVDMLLVIESIEIWPCTGVDEVVSTHLWDAAMLCCCSVSEAATGVGGRCAFRGDQRNSDVTVQGDDLVMGRAAVLDWSPQKRWQANVRRTARSHGERRRQWGQRAPAASRGSRSPQPLSDRWASPRRRTPHKCWRRRKRRVKASIQQEVWLQVSGRVTYTFCVCGSSSKVSDGCL